jgi:hypothetical protein
MYLLELEKYDNVMPYVNSTLRTSTVEETLSNLDKVRYLMNFS